MTNGSSQSGLKLGKKRVILKELQDLWHLVLSKSGQPTMTHIFSHAKIIVISK